MAELMPAARPLPWQTPLLAELLARARDDRLAHAWLLEGPQGLGKREFALALAWALLCRAPGQDGACGHCSACLLLLAGTQPDLRLVEPEEDKRAIRIEQLRDTVDFLGKTAQGGGRRVIVFCPAEAMNVNAANALLKSLEEPGPGSVLLLVSHQAGLLPATIRSRCQALRFQPPPRAAALAWLRSQELAEPEQLLALADGLPLRARALASEEAQAARQLLLAQLSGLLSGTRSALEAAESCASLGLDKALEGMLRCLADLLRHLQSGGAVPLREPSLAPVAAALAGAGAEQAPRLWRRLHALQERLLSARKAVAANTNPNVLLLLENLFIAWSRLPPPREPAGNSPAAAPPAAAH